MNKFRLLRALSAACMSLCATWTHAEPKLPNLAASETNLKAVEAAEKAAAAQQAAEKAAAAQKAADAAAAAEKAQLKAAAALDAQKAAEKAAAAQQVADKAAAAQKAADAATAAEKAQLKAAAAADAQKAAEKAAAAQKAADASAEKAVAAQQAADKAAVAQKAADAASKITDKPAASIDMQKVADKAAAAEKAATKALPATTVNLKEPVVPKATEVKLPAAPATRVFAAPILPPAGKDATKAADSKDPQQPTNPIADRQAKEEAARNAEATGNKNAAQDTADDARRVERITTREQLDGLGLPPDVANKLAEDSTTPDKNKADEAKGRIGVIADAAADLDVTSVPEAKRNQVLEEVSRSKDPKATADEKVGEAATEETFGKDVADKVPADKRGKFREVFTNLADIRGSLETLGGKPDDPEVKDAVNEGASKGVTSKEEAREIVERAGQKVLDRQGFPPAKEGETLGGRLDRIAKEQQAEEAARKAKEAAKAAARAAAKLKGSKLGKDAITQGAAGSTAVGRSVSAKVQVGIGGGKGNTSGAGSAPTGTGVDNTKTAGVGGRLHDDFASRQQAAGSGGQSTAGQVSTGNNAGKAPGTSSSTPRSADAAPATTPATNAQTTPGAGNNAQAPTTQTPNNSTPATQSPNNSTTPAPAQTGTGSGATSGSGSVSSPENEIVVGGGTGSSFGGHYQSTDGNTGGDLTFNADGTFSGTLTTVTRDANGNITSVTTTEVAGTWGRTESGEVVITDTTSATSQTTNNNQGGASSTSTQQSNQEDKNKDDDDDDNDDGNDDDDSADDEGSEDQAAENEDAAEDETADAEQSTESSTTPNPMDEGGGNPAELAIRTGGRLGGQEAKNQQRGLDMARSGGGAAGPSTNENRSSGVLLTPEEQANAARLLGMKQGNGVKDPNPLNEGGVAVTDRDLKDMNLRGNGGAKGPTDKTSPPKPQDPNSPVGGTPAPVPVGGTKLQAPVAPAVKVDTNKIKVDGQIKEQVR